MTFFARSQIHSRVENDYTTTELLLKYVENGWIFLLSVFVVVLNCHICQRMSVGLVHCNHII